VWRRRGGGSGPVVNSILPDEYREPVRDATPNADTVAYRKAAANFRADTCAHGGADF
jgi:hypothetical protein